MRVVLLVSLLLMPACSKSRRAPVAEAPRGAPTVGDAALVVVAPPPDAASPHAFVIVREPPVLLALVPAEAAKAQFGSGPFAAATTDHFTPSRDDAVRAWQALGPFLTQHPPRDSATLGTKYRTYKSQWVGLVVSGKRKLFANFFCSFDEQWEDHAIMVDDGGDCFFQIVFDLETSTFSDLMVNGMG